ncbi:MAG: hypothetical protein ACRDBX_05825 [Erysipelotrichaceae bacterium]
MFNPKYLHFLVRKNWQLFGLLFIIFFASTTLIMLNLEGVVEGYELQNALGFSSLILAISGIAIPTAMYKYLYSRKELDFYYALPIPKKDIFVTSMLFTWMVVLVPFMLNISASLLILQSKGFEALLPFLWSALSLLFAFIILTSIASFFIVKNHNLLDAIITTLLWLVLPLVLYLLWQTFLSTSVVGYGFSDASLMEKLTPFYLFVGAVQNPEYYEAISGITWMWWAVVAVGFFFTTYRIFAKLKVEDAQEINTSIFFYPTLTVSITFMGLLSFMGSLIVKQASFLESIIPLTLILILFLVANFIAKRSLANFVRSLLVYALLVGLSVAVAFTTIETKGFGFSQRVPQREDVASVRVENSLFPIAYPGLQFTSDTYEFKDPSVIDALLNAHQTIVDTYAEYDFDWMKMNEAHFQLDYGNTASFVYTLNNGFEMRRNFRVSNAFFAYEHYATLYNAPVVNEQLFEYLYNEDYTVATFNGIETPTGYYESQTLSKEALFKALRSDMRTLRFDSAYTQKARYIGSINVVFESPTASTYTINDRYASYPLFDFMEDTLAVLQDANVTWEQDLIPTKMDIALPQDNQGKLSNIFAYFNNQDFYEKVLYEEPGKPVDPSLGPTRYTFTSLPKEAMEQVLPYLYHFVADPSEDIAVVRVVFENGIIMSYGVYPEDLPTIMALLD